MVHRLQCPFAPIDGEHGDAVGPAVRVVQKLARGVNLNLRGGGFTLKVRGQCRDGLQSAQLALRGIPREGVHRRRHFIGDVRELAVGMKGEVTRTGAGLHLPERRIVWGQRALRGVEFEDEKLVQAQVGTDGKAVVRRWIQRMRVGPFLAARVGTLPLVLNEGRGFA